MTSEGRLPARRAIAIAVSAIGLAACGSQSGEAAGPLPTSTTPATTATPATSATPATPATLVLGPEGVGTLKLGMAPGAIEESGIATSAAGSPEDGWRPGCRALRYRSDVLGTIPGDTINGQVSPDQGLELLYATSQMRTPEGIGLGSTLDQVRQAFDRPDFGHRRDQLTVPASDQVVYVVRMSGTASASPPATVESISLGFKNLDCVI